MRTKLFVILLLFLFFPSSAFGYSYKSVLCSNAVSIPPTIEGPGIFLPDSPLFFIDELKQRIRLTLALTPEDKVLAYKKITGERMAELRFMLARQKEKGIRYDLQQLSDNFKSASEELENSHLSGKNISSLAKDLNNSIKDKRNTLDELDMGSNGELKKQIQATIEGLTEAKVKTEEFLPPRDLEREIKNNVDRETRIRLIAVAESTQGLSSVIESLEIQASESARQGQKNREAALRKIIEETREDLVNLDKSKVKKQQKDKEIELAKKRTAQEIEVGRQKIEAAIKKFQELSSERPSN